MASWDRTSANVSSWARRALSAGLASGLVNTTAQVGGALGQHERAAQRVIGASRLRRLGLGPFGPLQGLAEPVLEHLDARGHPFEKLINVLGVIAAHLLAELDFPKRLGRDVHGAMVVPAPVAVAIC